MKFTCLFTILYLICKFLYNQYKHCKFMSNFMWHICRSQYNKNKDNTVGLEDCFFLREINTWHISERLCIALIKFPLKESNDCFKANQSQISPVCPLLWSLMLRGNDLPRALLRSQHLKQKIHQLRLNLLSIVKFSELPSSKDMEKDWKGKK